MSIRIDTKTMDALQRHAEQTAYFDMLERTGQTEDLAKGHDAEWLARRKDLVEAFLPVVVQLARAGLIVLVIDLDPDEQDSEPSVAGKATIARMVDGVIQLRSQQ